MFLLSNFNHFIFIPPPLSLYLCGKNEFAHSADHSLLSAEPASAAGIPERTRFTSGISRASRLPFVSFQRLFPYFPLVISAVKMQFVPQLPQEFSTLIFDCSVPLSLCVKKSFSYPRARCFFANIPRYKPSRSFTNRSIP